MVNQSLADAQGNGVLRCLEMTGEYPYVNMWTRMRIQLAYTIFRIGTSGDPAAFVCRSAKSHSWRDKNPFRMQIRIVIMAVSTLIHEN